MTRHVFLLLGLLALGGCLPVHRANRYDHPDDAGWDVLGRVSLDQGAPMAKVYEVKPPLQKQYDAVRMRMFFREAHLDLFAVWLESGKELGKDRTVRLGLDEARTFRLPEPSRITRVDIQGQARGRGKGGGVLLILGKPAAP